jgi:Fe-S-cluster containining protein
MERHFGCTACGKCCEGWLPLSIPDALAHADRFPLFLLWTPVRPGGKSYDLSAKLGITLKLKNRKQAAVRVSPLSYVPTGMACPALGADGLCGIHETKPQRCRTMPLSASRSEADQTDLLLPRPGWECDTSVQAPKVYVDHKIMLRDDFAAERAQLEADARVLRPFAERLLDALPSLRGDLEKMAQKPQGGRLVTNFSTLLSCLAEVDIAHFAAQQFPVMESFAARTKDQPQYAAEHARYLACAKDWWRIVDGSSEN